MVLYKKIGDLLIVKYTGLRTERESQLGTVERVGKENILGYNILI